MIKLISLLKENAVLKLLSRKGGKRYRPEKHYMRGPGPKAQAKNGLALAGQSRLASSSPDEARK